MNTKWCIALFVSALIKLLNIFKQMLQSRLEIWILWWTYNHIGGDYEFGFVWFSENKNIWAERAGFRNWEISSSSGYTDVLWGRGSLRKIYLLSPYNFTAKLQTLYRVCTPCSRSTPLCKRPWYYKDHQYIFSSGRTSCVRDKTLLQTS